MKHQYHSLDILKFLMAFVVVAIHSEFVPAPLFPVARLAVPAFFILTGFFFFRKLGGAESPEAQDMLLKKTALRYAKLYLFWFVLLLPVTLYVRKYYQLGIGEAALTFVRDLLLGSTFPASWYLMACLEGIVIVHLLCRKFSPKTVLIIAAAVYILATASSELQGLLAQNAGYEALIRIIGKPYNNFLVAVPYICLGKAMAEGRFDGKTVITYAAGLGVSVAGLMVEWLILRRTAYFVFNCDCYVMLAPAALFLVLAVRELRLPFPGTVQARNISTILYCCHYPVVLVIREVRDLLHLPDPGNLLLFLAGAAVSLCVALIILKLERCRKLSWLKYAH